MNFRRGSSFSQFLLKLEKQGNLFLGTQRLRRRDPVVQSAQIRNWNRRRCGERVRQRRAEGRRHDGLDQGKTRFLFPAPTIRDLDLVQRMRQKVETNVT